MSSEPSLRSWAEQHSDEILTERFRQIGEENYTPEHDAEYTNNELIMAAEAYLLVTALPEYYNKELIPGGWPWDDMYWRPGTRKRNLIRAGALILAELERMAREETK